MSENSDDIKLTPKQQAALKIIEIVDYDASKCADPNYNLDGEDVDELLEKLDDYYKEFHEAMKGVK